MQSVCRISLVFLLILFSEVYCQDVTSYFADPATEPVEMIIDVSHLNAEIKIEPKDYRVIAKTTFDFTVKRAVTDSIVFYAPDFKFSKVEIKNVKSRYEIHGANIVVYPSGELSMNTVYSIVFEYVAEPHSGTIYFVGWNDPAGIMRKQIWAHRPHGWLPFIDDRLTVDMYVTFDKLYSVFSNGIRVSVVDNNDGTKTWHYRMEHNHPYFSTALVIGQYLFKSSKSKSGVPLELWYYPDQEDRFETTYQFSAEMIDFFEIELGRKYPYELYRQTPVADYLFGAMETTTSTVFGDYLFIDRRAYWQRNYINVNAHELAHQWFGNYISHLTPKDVWLTESFGTYYAKLFEKSVFGEDYYQNERLNEFEKAFSEAEKNSNPVASSRAGTNRIYQKGSLVLDMLRYVIGDDNFRRSVKFYLDKYQYEYAETQDFLRAIYHATGLNLGWFFDEWLYRGGEPHYQVSYNVSDDDNGLRNTQISIKQIQPVNNLVKYFKMPVDIVIYYKDGSHDSTRAMIENEFTVVSIPNSKRQNIDFVLFDPDNHILKKVTFNKEFSELSAQALKAPNMIDRYYALVSMRTIPLTVKLETLIKCYNKETFHKTKSEIIRQVASEYDNEKNAISSALNLKDNSPLALLKKAMADPDALVRKAVIDNISWIHVQLKKPFIELLRDTSYLNIELALTKLYEEYPKDLGLYLDITKDVTGWRGRNVRIKWIELSVLDGRSELISELTKFTSSSYDFETRMNAIQALKLLDYFDSDYCLLLFDAADYWNNKLSDVAKDAIKYYYVQIKNKTIIDNMLESDKISDDLKVTIRKYLK